MLDIDGILPKGSYPPCLRMADRALLAGYPRYLSAVCGCSDVWPYAIVITERSHPISRVSCQKGPICYASARRVGPFWQDTIDLCMPFPRLNHLDTVTKAVCWTRYIQRIHLMVESIFASRHGRKGCLNKGTESDLNSQVGTIWNKYFILCYHVSLCYYVLLVYLYGVNQHTVDRKMLS